MPRYVAGVVDDHVPTAILESIDLAIAIALDALDLRELVGVSLAAIEEREHVAAFQCQRGHVQADEARATEHEDPERLDLATERGPRDAGGGGELEKRASLHVTLLESSSRRAVRR